MTLKLCAGYERTVHAEGRMQQRGVSADAVGAALDYGRIVYRRGAVVYAIGRREVARSAAEGIDLSAYEGVQVICTSRNRVLTVYRNRDFRRLRSKYGRSRRRRSRNAAAPRAGRRRQAAG